MKTIIGSVPFYKASFPEIIEKMSSIIQENHCCHQVVTANAFSVTQAASNEAFSRVCNNADFVLADGLPIVWLSKILGYGLPERIAGPDLMWSFCKRSAERGYKMFLLGGQPEFLDVLVNNLRNAFPGILICGAYSPPFGEWDDRESDKIVSMINNAGADILWVGISTPKQDIWIYDHKQNLNVRIAIGVGAAFDFHSHRVKRAPLWMQKAGMEWFYRLMQEPRRMWKRYLFSNTLFLYLSARECIKALGNRKNHTVKSSSIT